MTPSQIGERAEAAVLAALVHVGKLVYLPFGASGRCDLIFEDEAGLHRVQVKNGILREGCIRFPTCSNTNNVPADYRGDIDAFGVYCDEVAAVYLVPVSAVPLRAGYLRLTPPRNNHSATFGGRSSSASTGPDPCSRPSDRGQHHTEVAQRGTGPCVPA